MSAALHEGQALTPFVVDPVDPGRMKTMAMLLRDPNPIHWDTEVTSRLGLGDKPINQGPTNVSYLLELAVRTAGRREGVLNLKARLLRNVFAGERVECVGTVTSVDEVAGTAELSLDALVDGASAVSATATVRLPD